MTSRAGTQRRPRTILIGLAAVGVLVALAADALARPGGGHTYSGGGGHGGSGGGGGGFFELILWLLRLVIIYPALGVPLLLIVIGFIAWNAYKQYKNRDWDSGPPVALEHAIDLGDMRQIDPDFSQVLFEDFAYRLFSTAHRARHSEATLATVAPYVALPARQALQTRIPATVPVQSVVVGAMRVVDLDVPNALLEDDIDDARAEITVEFEANVTTADHTYYSVETWLFSRAANVRSKPPKSRTFPCPNCGAPWASTDTGTQQCASCGEVVDNGRFDWVVESIVLRSIDERPPTLTENVPERGTDLPTYRDPNVDHALETLFEADPAITIDTLTQRLQMIYDQLNTAWTANDLRPIRGLVSDGLYDYLTYWIEAYTQQGLRNVLENMHITQHTFAKVTRDHWYDAVTVRIWGTGRDYTIRVADGDVVTGSKRFDRKYSEYWTLIRSAARRGPTVGSPNCPNCGAPLEITMAGACTHCSAHLTSGEFDWVLSKVEQDDSYRG